MFHQLRGHPVHTVDYGRGGTTIVGIAGAFGTCEIWEQPLELLSRTHRVIAYDHFGTGSTHVPAERVTFEEQVLLLESMLDVLAVDRCVLAGDSNMVAVAVEAALRWPHRFDGLVLVSGGVVHTETELVRRFIAGLREDFDATVDIFVGLCLPEDGSGHLRTWLRDIIRRTGGDRAALLLGSFHDVDLAHRLGEVAVPTVVITGEEDVMPSSTVALVRAMAERIPDCTLVELPGVGHVPTLSRPREVAEGIEELVRRIREERPVDAVGPESSLAGGADVELGAQRCGGAAT